MNRLVAIGVAAFLFGGGAAAAADLGTPTAPVPFVATPAAFDWNGPYFGVNGGWAWGDSRWNAPFFGTTVTTGDFDVSGGVLGVTLGDDWQNGPWVMGGVADIDWADISGDTPGSGAGSCGPNCATASDWLGTVRARIGYAHGPLLAYVTGGLAVGDVTGYHVTKNTGTSSSTEVGWAAGAGVEYAFAADWSASLEYLYADLGSSDCKVGVCSYTGPTTVEFATSLVRVGVNRRW